MPANTASKHPHFNLASYVGLAGFEEHERSFAHYSWNIFAFGLIFVAFILLTAWQKYTLGSDSSSEHFYASLLVWAYLLAGTVIMILLASKPWRFLKHNWLLPVSLMLGWVYIPLYHLGSIHWLRNLQPLLAFCLLTPSVGMLIRCFLDGKLSTTLWASAFIVVLFGFLIAGIDPQIHNVWDGVWWALSTVSTVGYGDVVPTSFLGRLLGACLIILGLGVFVTITANYLALLLTRERKAAKEQGTHHPNDEIQVEMMTKLDNMNKELAKLSKRVDAINKNNT